MSLWISKRPDGDVAAAAADSRGALAGLRLVVAEGMEGLASRALRDAGAVLSGVSGRGADVVTAGEADIALCTGIVEAGVGIKPTPGVILPGPADTVVAAADLETVNRAVAAIAATAPLRWPADTRFAAAPASVVAVPAAPAGADGYPFAAAVAALQAAGLRVLTAEVTPEMLHAAAPESLDALMVPTSSVVGYPAGLCAVAVPGVTVLARPFDDAVALDIAALAAGSAAPRPWPLTVAEVVEVVVFGAHLRGGPLEHQLTDLGARWAGELTTAAHYRMTVLPTTPAKPAITRVPEGCVGTGLRGHRWLLSPAGLGRFLTALPAPMQLGKVEFDDGSWRTAFSCDAAAATGTDISEYGSWPAAQAAGAV